MGQKVNPHGLRVGVIKDWDSRWYARDEKVGDLIVEDYKIRKYLKDLLYAAGIPRIEIERSNARVRILLHCKSPGMVIGRGGAEIEKLRLNLAAQLEKRISFRRAMKQSMGRAMRMGAKGIKTAVSGRLGGAEIARSEHYHEGTIPLQTLRADIDYGFAEAHTTYGRIGVKVWIYKGEILRAGERGPRTIEGPKPREERRERRDRGDRRFNNDRPRNNFNNRGGNSNNRGQGGYQRGNAPQKEGGSR